MTIAWDGRSSVGNGEICGQSVSRQRREYLCGYTDFEKIAREHGESVCDGVKFIRTLPIFRKRSLPDTIGDTRPSQRKKVGVEQKEKVTELFKKVRRNRKIRAAEEDVARRRESLRSYTPLKNSDEGCRISGGCAHGGNEAREDDGKKLQMTLSESHQQSFKKLDASNNPEEAAPEVAKLLTGLQELDTNLQVLDVVFRRCKELSNTIGTTQTSQGKLRAENEGGTVPEMSPPYCEILDILMRGAQNSGRIRNSVTGAVGKFDHDEVIEIISDSDGRGKLIHLISNSDEEGDSRHSDKEEFSGQEVTMLCSDDGERADGTVVISSEDEEGANGKKILNMDHGRQSHSEKLLEGQVVARASSSDVEVVPMEPVVCKPLACLQQYVHLSTRIRKDGKRWRKTNLRWTHIKQKHIRQKRFGEAGFSKTGMNLRSLLRKRTQTQALGVSWFSNEGMNLQSLLRKENQKERLGEAGFSEGSMNLQSLLRKGRPKEEPPSPDDTADEDVPYDVYRPTSHMAKEVEPDPDEEELEDIFQEMALALDKGWEKREAVDKQTALHKDGGCSHDYVLQQDVGWVCEKCGLVGQDIQSIFIQDSTRPKKKTAIVPVEEELLDPEIQDDEGLSFAQGVLPRVTLALHPYYEECLHPHQKEGVTFLTRSLLGDAQMQLPPGGCILAHAPGTGKSCLTVSFVQSFLTAYPTGRPLIVAPKIMLRQWQNEFKQWNVDEIPVYNLNETVREGKGKSCRERHDLAIVITSTPYYRERLECRRLRLMKKWLEARSVLLISYNLFASLVLAGLNDEITGSVKQQLCEALLDGPELLILDEGHFPRTKRTKISQALMRVRTNRKIMLSGTLFQNNFKELFNLMKLARHDFMSLSPEFATRLKKLNPPKETVDEDDYHFAGRTHNELDPAGRECEEQMFMEDVGYKLEEFVDGAENFDEINLALRKLRALTGPIVHWYTGQILESLPGLCEFVLYLNLTAHQHKLLSRLKCKSSFEEKTRLAEVCIHPELLKYAGELENSLPAGDKNTFNAQHEPSEGVKTAFLFKLLRLCHITGERLLIFCQTLSPLTLIESMLAKELGWSRGNEVLRLDGTMQSDERQSMIEQFNNESSRARVMLASITACKEGISLVGASRVVILDVLYNPSVVRQAVSRAFRIGQKKRVYVYRLVAADTKEERIFQAAVQKDWLSRVLMNHSLRMSCGKRYRAEKILQLEKVPDDRILQKMLHTDAGERINRVCRYHSQFST